MACLWLANRIGNSFLRTIAPKKNLFVIATTHPQKIFGSIGKFMWEMKWGIIDVHMGMKAIFIIGPHVAHLFSTELSNVVFLGTLMFYPTIMLKCYVIIFFIVMFRIINAWRNNKLYIIQLE